MKKVERLPLVDQRQAKLQKVCVTYIVHVHVHQMMIMSTDDPSSIWLKENRERTGHFAAHSISPAPAHHQSIFQNIECERSRDDPKR